MAEPLVKKMKTDEDELLYRCKRNKELMQNLSHINMCIDQGESLMVAAFLEMGYADASHRVNFSQAMCDTKMYDRQPVTLGSFFGTGVRVLKRFIESKDDECVPDDASIKEALKRLLTFLSEEPPEELFKPGRFNGFAWAVFLAEHVFTKLKHGSQYKMDQHYSGGSSLQKELFGPYYCPCKNNEKISGDFCDTTFGCTMGWHGSVDILIEDVPVCVTPAEDSEDQEDPDNSCSVVSDCSRDSSEEVRWPEMQMYSQCIVFSFLQRKKDFTLKNFLTPLVGITTNKVEIKFYDCENDILLKTAELDLTTEEGLQKEVIVLLWLTLNYKLFCTGVPEGLRSYKAKFFEKAGDKLKYYREDVRSEIGRLKNEVADKNVWARKMPEPYFSVYP